MGRAAISELRPRKYQKNFLIVLVSYWGFSSNDLGRRAVTFQDENFLISENIASEVTDVQIYPGYRTDH